MFTTKPASDTPDSVLQAIKKTAGINESYDQVSVRHRHYGEGDKKLVNEDEQIEELSNNTLKSYVQKADGDRSARKLFQPDQAHRDRLKAALGKDDPVVKGHEDDDRKIKNRTRGMAHAATRLTEDLTKTTRGKYFGRSVSFKGLEHPINEDLTKEVEKEATQAGKTELRSKYLRRDQEGVQMDPSGQLIGRYKNDSNANFELYKNSNDVLELRDSKRQVLKSWHTDNKEVFQKLQTKYGLMPDPVEDNYAANEKKEEQKLAEDLEVFLMEAPRIKKATLLKHINDGKWEAMQDIKDRQHVDLRHTETGQRKTVFVEDLEQIDELSRKTLGSYVKKAGPDKDRKENQAKQSADLGHDMKNLDGNYEGARKQFRRAGQLDHKVQNRRRGILRAVDKLVREDAIEDGVRKSQEFRSKYKYYQNTPHGYGYLTGHDPKKPDHGIVTISTGKGVRSKNNNPTKEVSVHKKHLQLKEDVEQIDELSAATKSRYMKAAKNNLKYHSDAWDELAKKPSFSKKENGSFNKHDKEAEKRYKGIARAKRSIGRDIDKAYSVKEGVEDSFKRLVGTDSLKKTYLDDTPGQTDGSEPKAVNEGYKVGDMVRMTNPNANPGYEVISKNATHYTLKHRYRKTPITVSKERVHKVNAGKRLTEDAEPISEMSRWKTRAYRQKAIKQLGSLSRKKRELSAAAEHAKDKNLPKTAERLEQKAQQAHNKLENRRRGINKTH